MKKESQDFTEETRTFWKEHSGIILSEEESTDIVKNLSGFFRILSEWEKNEKENEK